ncbi:wiskott-Aldrich syndrome protein family member 1 isoform X1 [Bubalus bubalis]|uniref:wiskott-Aldrich syndrome protein family member 1 isoform X1 n=1 Tax=Bubalus bubalis TaxID=89462 RepID=UPI001D10BB32|nr:wiskott-Aldrich syndrome protein family member 1 isoform X1 [Bubalus bubalis]
MAARPPCRPACSSASVSLGLPWAGVPSPLTPPLPDRHHTTASHILEESLGEFSLPAEPEAPPSRDKHVRGDPECPLHICGVTDDSPAQTPPDPAQVAQWQLQVPGGGICLLQAQTPHALPTALPSTLPPGGVLTEATHLAADASWGPAGLCPCASPSDPGAGSTCIPPGTGSSLSTTPPGHPDSVSG